VSGFSKKISTRGSPRGEAVRQATPALVAELLEECRLEVLGAMKPYLAAAEPSPYLYELAADYPRRGGKMMRPSICIATARAFGARSSDAVRSAVAIELLHNAFLVHDDIEDESEMRRGAPALHSLHGVPLALNAGDAMLLLSLRPLLDNRRSLGAELALDVLLDTERMARESAEGQAMELGWRRDNIIELEDEDYFTMVLKKTSWLAVIYPARVGAMIGTRGLADLDQFIRFGFLLGVAFQIQDDLLNLGADHRYGKEALGDLFEGKRTLMLIHAFRCGTPTERARLKSILAAPRSERRPEEVVWIRGLMERYDSLDYARRIGQGLAGAALHEFAEIFGRLPASRDKDFLRGLITWIFERT
jgi:geranylgeranyl diphosphate synthase type II